MKNPDTTKRSRPTRTGSLVHQELARAGQILKPSRTEASAAAPANLADDVRPREVWGWMMFDFAKSGYTTVVITAVFNAYFVAVVASGEVWSTFAWTLALSVSYALIVVTGPLIGAYAD